MNKQTEVRSQFHTLTEFEMDNLLIGFYKLGDYDLQHSLQQHKTITGKIN